MTDIAKECDIGVASLYRYFSTKEAIAIEVGKLWWRQIKEFLKPRFEKREFLEKNGIGRIEAILDAYSELFEKQRDFLLFLDDFDAFCLKEYSERKTRRISDRNGGFLQTVCAGSAARARGRKRPRRDKRRTDLSGGQPHDACAFAKSGGRQNSDPRRKLRSGNISYKRNHFKLF